MASSPDPRLLSEEPDSSSPPLGAVGLGQRLLYAAAAIVGFVLLLSLLSSFNNDEPGEVPVQPTPTDSGTAGPPPGSQTMAPAPTEDPAYVAGKKAGQTYTEAKATTKNFLKGFQEETSVDETVDRAARKADKKLTEWDEKLEAKR